LSNLTLEFQLLFRFFHTFWFFIFHSIFHDFSWIFFDFHFNKHWFCWFPSWNLLKLWRCSRIYWISLVILGSADNFPFSTWFFRIFLDKFLLFTFHSTFHWTFTEFRLKFNLIYKKFQLYENNNNNKLFDRFKD
jgi:hypothetical protein